MFSPAKFSPAKGMENKGDFVDDIDCIPWLEEINLSQYTQTFLLNFSKDGRMLSRKRLEQVRLKDFPFMNIIIYQHQKILMEHIRHVLQYSYHSPLRKRDLRTTLNSKYPDYALPSFAEPKSTSLTPTSLSSKDDKRQDKDKDSKDPGNPKPKKLTSRRRRSFDNNVWNAINGLRTKTQDSSKATDMLREGLLTGTPVKPQMRGRRRSYDKDADVAISKPKRNLSEAINPHDKAMIYGNMALEYDKMMTDLSKLQSEDLMGMKKQLQCDSAWIFFVHEITRDLLLWHGDTPATSTWYRIPKGSGIAGHVAETGECLNIPDVYKDWRYNANLDIRLGYKTSSVLCQPLRSKKGGGDIIGCIMLMNKNSMGPASEAEFDGGDEQTLSILVHQIADEYQDRLAAITSLAEKMSGIAIFVGQRGGGVEDMGKHGYAEPTKSMYGQRATSTDDIK